nr:MAG TPA: hypothetical protein [Caudoviricetes sp.]
MLRRNIFLMARHIFFFLRGAAFLHRPAPSP